MGSNNNRYDEEFKASAVKMVVEKGHPISAVAKDLGVSQPALRRWIKASTEQKMPLIKDLLSLKPKIKNLKNNLRMLMIRLKY